MVPVIQSCFSPLHSSTLQMIAEKYSFVALSHASRSSIDLQGFKKGVPLIRIVLVKRIVSSFIVGSSSGCLFI